jgi:hypothetical protein
MSPSEPQILRVPHPLLEAADRVRRIVEGDVEPAPTCGAVYLPGPDEPRQVCRRPPHGSDVLHDWEARGLRARVSQASTAQLRRTLARGSSPAWIAQEGLDIVRHELERRGWTS